MADLTDVTSARSTGMTIPQEPAPEALKATEQVTTELVRAGSLLTRESDVRSLTSVLVDQSLDITGSDLGAAYLFSEPGYTNSPLRLMYRRGRYSIPRKLDPDLESIAFVGELQETLVLHGKGRRFFEDAFLHKRMHSAIVAPIVAPAATFGVLILNSVRPEFYHHNRLRFVESFVPLAAGMLHNSELLDELREKLRRIEALERYQESIFASMTNLLITVNRDGAVRYFNYAAGERLGLHEEHVGRPFNEVFGDAVDKGILSAVDRSRENGEEQLGIEGIIAAPKRELDFSLNISPLRGKRGRREGLTLLFTDQTAERELKGQMQVATEERRAVKDMFARYLSNELVENLMQHPNKIRLGGDKKLATTFFADIRGYTTFAEGKDPEHIVEVLNGYFQEAVEVIVTNGGYIDKFIGDAIMAIWGVPLESEEQDAVNAVSCALELQERVNAPDRTFFTGDAANLKVGIGMHTGPLVAGNLGSAQRMDYSVIGDSVNVAARLESIAEGGQVIITRHTREIVGDRFKVKELKPVRVKGKEQPIPIFHVLGIAR